MKRNLQFSERDLKERSAKKDNEYLEEVSL